MIRRGVTGLATPRCTGSRNGRVAAPAAVAPPYRVVAVTNYGSPSTVSSVLSWTAVRATTAAVLAGGLLTTCVPLSNATVAGAMAGDTVVSEAIGVPEGEGEGLGLAEAPVEAPQLPTSPSLLSVPPLPGQPVPAGGVPGAPAAGTEGTPAEVAPVTLQRPRVSLRGPAPEGTDPLATVLSVPDVTAAASLVVGEVVVTGGSGPQPVSVAAVDPEAFRAFTPQVTAEAAAVWQRVAEGDAAITHDAGRRLAVELGQRAPTGDGTTTVRVGAFASNGAPPVADAIVSTATGEALGVQGEQRILVGLTEGADPAAVAVSLAEATGMTAEVIAQPQLRQAFLTGAAARDAFEPFDYVDNGDGMIQIDSDWTRRNIVTADVPILNGSVTCHRQLIPQLRGALQEIEDRGLAPLIDVTQYGGCWVPRHIDFNPAKPLSMHGWGLAVDLNVSTNGLGQTPTMDPRIVEVFDRWGFVWGGRWRRPDGMHFELGALLTDAP